MRILAIDPGTTESGWMLFDDEQWRPIEFGKDSNSEVMDTIATSEVDATVVEMFQSFGMPVGAEVFETAVWLGRFVEASYRANFTEPARLYRKDVKLHLCRSVKAKDPNVRQALLDKFPATGGGTTPQKGIKSKPGPLYGVTADVWSALALAVTYSETRGK